jgi:hypothetical protein
MRKMNFFTTMEIFENWSFTEMKNLYLNSEIVIYSKGEYLFK